MPNTPKKSDESLSNKPLLTSKSDDVIEAVSDKNKSQVEMIISEEELIKNWNKVISLLKLKKFKELKIFLNRFNEQEFEKIVESKYQDIENEIEKSFSKTWDATFFHIYNAFAPYVNKIIVNNKESLLKFYAAACTSQQKTRVKMLENTFWDIVDLSEWLNQSTQLNEADEEKLRRFLQDDRLLHLNKDLQRFIRNIWGIKVCKNIIIDELKELIQNKWYKQIITKIYFLSWVYPELDLIPKSLLNECIVDLLSESDVRSILKMSALYNETWDKRLFEKMIEYANESQLDESILMSICKTWKIYSENDIFFQNISKEWKVELIEEFLFEMKNDLVTDNDILWNNPECLNDVDFSNYITKDFINCWIKSEDIDLEISGLFKSISDGTICIKNYLSHLPLLKESIKYISIEDLDSYFSGDESFEFNIWILKKYIFNDSESKVIIFEQLISHLHKLLGTSDINEENYDKAYEESTDLHLQLHWDQDLFTFFKENLNIFDCEKIIHFYLNIWYDYDSTELLYFISYHKDISEEGLLNRFNQLKQTYAPYLISSENHDQELSQLDEIDYMFLNNYVYKKGDYSSHEDNIKKCENHLDHLDEYSFNKEWYPVILNWLKGYELKNWEKEDIKLLSSYSKRIENIHNINNQWKLNKEDFYELLEWYFLDTNISEFKKLENLSTEEKMICLLIWEIIKIDNWEDANSEILDLILIYGYVFVNSLWDYVQQTRDVINKEKDQVSQNRVLWNELSNIYGEDIKHTLRNQVFEQWQKWENFKQILSIYLQNIWVELEQESIKDKQLFRIKHTLDNDNIPDEKKYSIIEKQIIQIFKGGMKLDNDSQSNFETEVLEELKVMKGEFDFEIFSSITQNLLNIKEKYKNKLDKKLENLFTRDINNISNEVKKYQEVHEVEEKTVNMSGKNKGYVKKVSKSREIVWHFTKSKESSNARMWAYICLAWDASMWKNCNYFELILQNTETKQCEWLVMLLNIEARDGKKYLWFWPNPNQSFLEKVSSEKCYNYLYETVCDFAQENNYDWVVVPSSDNAIVWQCTNRWWDFPEHIKQSRLKDKKWAIKIVDFWDKHELAEWYGYLDWALIWEK